MSKQKLLLAAIFVILVVSPTVAQEEPSLPVEQPYDDPIVIKPLEAYCNIYTLPVHIPDYYPFNSSDVAKVADIPETLFGGCYETEVEALRAGSGGGIDLADDATKEEIMQAVEAYRPSPNPTLLSNPPETWQEATASAVLYAKGYDMEDYMSWTFEHWDGSGLACSLIDYWLIVQDYGDFAHPAIYATNWNDKFDSFAGLNGCSDVWLFRDPFPEETYLPQPGNPFHYLYGFSAELHHPSYGDFRNWTSASVIGNWSATNW